jgi:hypothetical protein
MVSTAFSENRYKPCFIYYFSVLLAPQSSSKKGCDKPHRYDVASASPNVEAQLGMASEGHLGILPVCKRNILGLNIFVL